MDIDYCEFLRIWFKIVKEIKNLPQKAMGEVFLTEIYFENLLYKFILVSKHQLIIKRV